MLVIRDPEERGPTVRPGAQRRILETIRRRGPQTADELTKLLGGGRAAMGTHLRHLLAASLLAYEEEKRPLGRPARRYRLTPEADALFPKHYQLLAVKLTEALSGTGPKSLDGILARWREELVAYFEARLPGDGPARLAALAEHQTRFGFMASVQQGPDGPVLLERNCPIAVVASRFPRICDQEAALFEAVLRRGVDLSTCQARGEPVCAFRIARPAP